MPKREMPDDINDGVIIDKALAYAIEAIDALPEQLQDKTLLERIKGVLGLRVTTYDQRSKLLGEARRHVSGLGTSLSSEINERRTTCRDDAVSVSGSAGLCSPTS